MLISLKIEQQRGEILAIINRFIKDAFEILRSSSCKRTLKQQLVVDKMYCQSHLSCGGIFVDFNILLCWNNKQLSLICKVNMFKPKQELSKTAVPKQYAAAPLQGTRVPVPRNTKFELSLHHLHHP